MPDKQKVLAGRNAVDAYRSAHSKLYERPWHKGIPEEHTPLLNIMLKAFKGLGFNTIQEFFDASELLNIQELGYATVEKFWGEVGEEGNYIVAPKSTKAEREAISGMWH